MAEKLTQITIVEKPIHQLLPGEVTFEHASCAWYIGCPAATHEGAGNLSGHQTAYDEQAKVLTVSPSILCGCGAHYFVEHNKIRWV